jgi:hypothetical protein
VLQDTPGILEETFYRLHEGMMDAVRTALDEAEVPTSRARCCRVAARPRRGCGEDGRQKTDDTAASQHMPAGAILTSAHPHMPRGGDCDSTIG